MTTAQQTEYKQVTFRKTGKAHRGFIVNRNDGRGEYLSVACSCPGSNNGRLKNGARIVAEGWDRANCGG